MEMIKWHLQQKTNKIVLFKKCQWLFANSQQAQEDIIYHREQEAYQTVMAGLLKK